jgi:hypothetical protein
MFDDGDTLQGTIGFKLVLAVCCVLAILFAGTVLGKVTGVVCTLGGLSPSSCPATSTAIDEARLVLSTSAVEIGDTYTATAKGFRPGETVSFSWTGPSTGVIGTSTVDSAGEASTQVWEGAAPGSYTIIVTGLESGCTASAGLRVIASG